MSTNDLRLKLADLQEQLQESIGDSTVPRIEIEELRCDIYRLEMQLKYLLLGKRPSIVCEDDPDAPECRLYDV